MVEQTFTLKVTGKDAAECIQKFKAMEKAKRMFPSYIKSTTVSEKQYTWLMQQYQARVNS